MSGFDVPTGFEIFDDPLQAVPQDVTLAVASLLAQRPGVNPGDGYDLAEVRELVRLLQTFFSSVAESVMWLGWTVPAKREGEEPFGFFCRVLAENQVHPLAVGYALGVRYFVRRQASALGGSKLVVMNHDAKNTKIPQLGIPGSKEVLKERLESGIAAVWLPPAHGGPWGHA
jgi:hypothetical protein